MAKVSAVLFDLDGTIRDTVDTMFEAIEHSFRSFGTTAPSREEMLPYAHYHEHIRAQFLPSVSSEEFEAIYIKRGDENVLHAKLYDGIDETVRTLRDKGYRLAIVSSGGDIAGYLRVVGLEDQFEVLIGARDVEHKKPHPEAVIKALERLGISADEAIMIGDLPTDIQAAQAAGVSRTIGVTYGMGGRESLEAAGASYVIDDPREIVACVKKEDTV